MKLIFWIALFVILFLILVRYIESRSIFFPMKEIYATPESIGLLFKDTYFYTSDNKRLNGWFIENDKARHTIIICHGNAGNISHRLDKISMLYDLGLSIFIFDYRGYGRSEGTPIESGLYEDAYAAYRHIMKEFKISNDKIILYGESIGGVVAINLAHKAEVKALITEGTITSTGDMAKIFYPFLPRLIFSTRFDALSKVKNLSCHKLIIHSLDDEIVPFHLGQKLFDAAGYPKVFLKIRGTHNTAFLDSRDSYLEGIKSFLGTL